MTSPAEKILEHALSLSEEERRALAERLRKSLPRDSSDAIARAWDDEVLDRLEAADRGEVVTREWDDVRRELRAKYART
ncbi:MAG: addiction module protein [Sandaracinaceae bacterium]|nr:addiction module protein [Sandaracinaceae bacterium]